MKLTETEYQDFLRLHQGILHYVGTKKKMFSENYSVDDFVEHGLEKILDVRNALYASPSLIQAFVKENPMGFSEADLEIVKGWKHVVMGDFFVIKYLKKYTVFLKDGVAYGVIALGDTLEYMLGGQKPILIKTALLPFKGKIVFDGIMQGYNLSFGGGYRKSIAQDYNVANAAYGIVTELPFDKGKQPRQTPSDKLDLYMKTQQSRSYHSYDIEDLLDKHPELVGRYYWNWGRINARQKKKALKSYGINGLHYAIINETIIAQGKSLAQVQKMVKAILPKAKLDWVFYFQVK